HHADDRVRRPSDADGAPDDVRVAAEEGLPRLVSEHDDVRRARRLVRLQQRPPEQGTHMPLRTAPIDARPGTASRHTAYSWSVARPRSPVPSVCRTPTIRSPS